MTRFLFALLIACPLPAASLGAFEDHADVGTVLHAGSAEYDPSAESYTVSGSGENMWFASDAFHFVWKRMSGDGTFSSDIAFLSEGGDPHRKAVLMIRQSLDADSAYADVAVHGNGLTSLQVRGEKGDATHEIESSVSAPRRVSIVKQGDIFRILVDGKIAGGSMRAGITESYYVGIGVCAHNKDAVQKVLFSKVEIARPKPGTSSQVLDSTIEVINVASTDRRVFYVTSGQVTEPSFAPDGLAITFTKDGNRESVPAQIDRAETSPERRGFPTLSPDGKLLAFESLERSDVFLRVLSVVDNKVRVLAKLPAAKGLIDSPSWSQDSKRLVFVSYQLVN